MGHAIHHATYDEKVNKDKVQRFWDSYAAHEDWQEGCTGLPSKIRWQDVICDSYEAAEAFIEARDSGWYDQLAVKYRDTSHIAKTSSTKERLCQQIASYKTKLIEYDKAHSISTFKAEFVACPFCKSKLAKSYLAKAGTNGCPVCRAKDIRSEYIINQLKAYQDKITKWEAELKSEEKKLAQKCARQAIIKWLVKVEYHV